MGILDPANKDHAHAAERLREEPIVWLTTVTLAGQPQSTPVWFHWDGDDMAILSRPASRKLENIEGNPRVSVHLDSDDDGEDVVTFEGLAVTVDELPVERREAYLAKYRGLIARQEWTDEGFLADYSTVLHVTPTRVRAWH
jgi:PPOX class probable F420-dependent enzyme